MAKSQSGAGRRPAPEPGGPDPESNYYYMKDCMKPGQVKYLTRVLKALGHPLRVQIVNGLMERECNVKHMTECLHTAQATVSQQLAVLRAAGVVSCERRGNQVCYRVASPTIRRLVRTINRMEED